MSALFDHANITKKGPLMKCIQLPIISNNATTGHKLQGSSVDNLFIHSWNYSTNWPYVVLSQVQTLSGIYLLRPLSLDVSKYSAPNSLLIMINKLKMRIPKHLDMDEYEFLSTQTSS